MFLLEYIRVDLVLSLKNLFLLEHKHFLLQLPNVRFFYYDFEETNAPAGGESSTNGEEGELAELEAIRERAGTQESSVPHES